jgi:hypothetical protein
MNSTTFWDTILCCEILIITNSPITKLSLFGLIPESIVMKISMDKLHFLNLENVLLLP